MVACITDMLKKGCAYQVDGHTMFDVAAYKEFVNSGGVLGGGQGGGGFAGGLFGYGALSGRNKEEHIGQGVRDIDHINKKSPEDFVLWKPVSRAQSKIGSWSKSDDPQEMGWQTELGYGRPGWHTECVAMSTKNLGVNFDIHGGGVDLKFPHHENELAQAQCINPHGGFAKYWIHNGILLMDGKKMSKTDGNIVKLGQLRDYGFSGSAVKYFLLSAHYRQPLNTHAITFFDCQAVIDRMVGLFEDWEADAVVETTDTLAFVDFEDLLDDFNTPKYFAKMNDIAKQVEAAGSRSHIGHDLRQKLFSMGLLVGLWSKKSFVLDLARLKRMEPTKVMVSFENDLQGLASNRTPDALTPAAASATAAANLSAPTSCPAISAPSAPCTNPAGEDNKAGFLLQKVIGLAKDRFLAKERKDYKAADAIRGEIALLGFELQDSDRSVVIVDKSEHFFSRKVGKVAPTAVVGSMAKVGVGVVIEDGAIIEDGATVGDCAIIARNAKVASGGVVGSFAVVEERVVVEKGCIVGWFGVAK